MSVKNDSCNVLENENSELKLSNKTLQFELEKLQLEYNSLLETIEAKSPLHIGGINVCLDVKSKLYKNKINSLISLGDLLISDLTDSVDCIKREISVLGDSCFLKQVNDLDYLEEAYVQEIKKLKEEISLLKDGIFKHCRESIDVPNDLTCINNGRDDKVDPKFILGECVNFIIHNCCNISSVNEVLEEIKCASEIENFLNECKVDELIKCIKPDFQSHLNVNWKCKTAKLKTYMEWTCVILNEILHEKEKSVRHELNYKELENSLTSTLNYLNINKDGSECHNDIIEKLMNVILVFFKCLQEVKNEYRNLDEECIKCKHQILNLKSHISTLLSKFQLIHQNVCEMKNFCVTAANDYKYSSACDSVECTLDVLETAFNNLQLGNVSEHDYKRMKERNELLQLIMLLTEHVDSIRSLQVYPEEKVNDLYRIRTALLNEAECCNKKINYLLNENEELFNRNSELSNSCEKKNQEFGTTESCDACEDLKYSKLVSLNTALQERISKNEQEIALLLREIINKGGISINIALPEVVGYTEGINETYQKTKNYDDDNNKLEHIQFPVTNEKKVLLSLQVNMKLLTELVTEFKSLLMTLSSVLRNMISDILGNISEVNSEIQFVVRNVFQSMMSSLESRNEDLLKDMLEMNTELKKRGETISHLNESFEDMEKHKYRLLQQYGDLDVNYANKLAEMNEEIRKRNQLIDGKTSEVEAMKKNHETQVNRLLSDIEKLEISINDLQRKIVEKESTINDLEQEICRRDTQDGDTSSMGTISRTDESSRLRDIEDSFEDRYNKLRILAVKMKKRIAELNQQLETERNSFSSEKVELQNKLSQLMPKVKLSQTLQSECDKLNDALELKETEIKELKKIVKEGDENISNLEAKVSHLLQQLEESKMTAELLAEDKKRLEEKILSIMSQLDKLEEEKGTKDSANQEKDHEIQLLKQKINEGEESLTKLKSDFEEAKLEIRKQGTLSLEMKHYEKTVSDLMNQLSMEKNKCQELNEKVNESLEINCNLTERIRQLETEIGVTDENNKLANEEILRLNKRFTDYERSLTEREESLQKLTELYRSAKSKADQLENEVAKLHSDRSVEKEKFENIQISLTKQVNSLQIELSALKDQATKKEYELERINKDFENYKVRAQSILQKHKAENTAKCNENLLKQQVEDLEKTIDELTKQLADNKNEFETYRMDMHALELEQGKFRKKNKELNNLFTEKSTQLDSVIAEFKSYKSDVERRINLYEDEIEKLKGFKTEVYDLKKKYEDAVSETDSLKQRLENASLITRSYSSNAISHGPNIDLQQRTEIRRKISDVPSLADSTSYSNEKPALMSLENLLSNNIDEDALLKLKQQLLTYEEQVRNLEFMLHESEDNLTRNEHQVSVLKDEIRRLQRTIEREPHIQNTEYLKNVILKFLTLQYGEERMRLIPVLETILKLSPEESQQLSLMTKDGTTEGWSKWGNFLNWKG